MMIKNLKKIVVTSLLVTGGITTFAADQNVVIQEESLITPEKSPWAFTIGTTFKNIKDVKYHGVQSAPGQYFDGSYDLSTGGITVDDDSTQVTPGIGVGVGGQDHISLNRLNFQGESDSEDATGLVLGMSRVLSQHEGGSFNLELSLVTLITDFSSNSGSSVITDVYAGTGGSGDYNGNPVSGDNPPGALPATVNVNFELDMGVYTFGAGLSHQFDYSNGITLKYGFGPTLTIVDYDFEGVMVDGNGKLGTKSSDGVELLFGVYAAADVMYNFDHNWAAGAGVRYDYIDELEDDVADVDLSGLSFELKVMYSF